MLTTGHVRVYDWVDDAWTQAGNDIYGKGLYDSFGHSVAMSGDGMRIAIGAPMNDDVNTNSGSVRVYDYDSDRAAWTQTGSDIDGEAAGDQSGSSVTISADGLRIAIGAVTNDVRVYKLIETTWTQVGLDIDGQAGENSGFSVAMSADGSRIANGAVGGGAISGSVRVYLDPTSRTEIFGDLGGQTLSTPGVYYSSAAFALSKTLTLDAKNNPDGKWIFESAGALASAAETSVKFKSANTGSPNNVFWEIAGAATTGAGSIMIGNVIAVGGIDIGAVATWTGNLTSINGPVTLGAGSTVFGNTTAYGAITLDPGATSGNLTSTNGAIGLGASATTGHLSAPNGATTLGAGAEIDVVQNV
jgi:hypothetical protein